MAIYLRGSVWWINLRHRGRRIRRSARTGDKLAAQRQHDELKARLWQEKQAGRQLSDALAAWLKAKPRSRNQLGVVKEIRKAYPDRPLIDVTGSSVVEVFGDLAPGNYNRFANVIRAAMNIAARRDWIQAAPKIERRAEPALDVVPLTGKQWKALRAELPDHLRLMADFAIATGLRWSNVAGLEWERVDLRRKLAWIQGSAAKARKPIAVPLSAAALAALRAAPRPRTGFVFRYHGEPITSPKTAWRKAVKRAGLDGFRWHDLRHTWASWHAMAGTPLEALQKLGAWESREMVQRYAHLAPSYVAGFADNAKVPKAA